MIFFYSGIIPEYSGIILEFEKVKKAVADILFRFFQLFSASSPCVRPPLKVTAPHANNYVNKNRNCLKVRLAAFSQLRT